MLHCHTVRIVRKRYERFFACRTRARTGVAYEHMLDFVRDNETIEDDSGKYLDVVEHIAKDIYEHTDIDDNSDFSATDVACAIMNEATIHYWYWEEPEY